MVRPNQKSRKKEMIYFDHQCRSSRTPCVSLKAREIVDSMREAVTTAFGVNVLDIGPDYTTIDDQLVVELGSVSRTLPIPSIAAGASVAAGTESWLLATD